MVKYLPTYSQVTMLEMAISSHKPTIAGKPT